MNFLYQTFGLGITLLTDSSMVSTNGERFFSPLISTKTKEIIWSLVNDVVSPKLTSLPITKFTSLFSLSPHCHDYVVWRLFYTLCYCFGCNPLDFWLTHGYKEWQIRKPWSFWASEFQAPSKWIFKCLSSYLLKFVSVGTSIVAQVAKTATCNPAVHVGVSRPSCSTVVFCKLKIILGC